MDSNTYTDQSVINEAQNFISVKINVDQQPAVAQQFNVSSIPVVVWLDSNGNERNRVVGGYSPAEFVPLMQSAR